MNQPSSDSVQAAKPAGYFGETRGEMLAFLPDQYERVLEVGCGEGRFARQLRQGSEIWGIEPDAGAAQEAATFMNRTLVGLFDDVCTELPEGYFDLVICNDVVEHMTDHDKFFRDIQKFLRPAGALVVSVPNIRHISVMKEILFKADFQYQDEGILDRTHFRFFTLRSLRRSVEGAGFQIEKFHGINPMKKPWRLSSKRLLFWLFVVLSFGRWTDMRFLQIGFRARTPGR